MNYAAFMASLAKGKPPHVFLLAGEESYYVRRAEDAILRRLLPNEEDRADALIRYEEMPPIDALMESLETAPFFTDKIVVLVHDAAIFRAAKKKETEEDAPAPKDTAADALITRLADLLPTSLRLARSPTNDENSIRQLKSTGVCWRANSYARGRWRTG